VVERLTLGEVRLSPEGERGKPSFWRKRQRAARTPDSFAQRDSYLQQNKIDSTWSHAYA